MTCFLKRKQASKLLLVSFWACMNWISHAFQFPTNIVPELHLFKAKKFDWFLALFQPFFPARPTSASYTHPLKVLSEGPMVQNLPFGSKEAPKTITGKKIPHLPILNYTPSPLCSVTSSFQQVLLLKKHEISHSKQKPFGCSHCDFKCSYWRSMKYPTLGMNPLAAPIVTMKTLKIKRNEETWRNPHSGK